MRKKGREDCRFIDRTGERYYTNQGYWLEIIECFGAKNVTVRFEDGGVVRCRSMGNITAGKVENPNHLSVCGIGFEGQGKYSFKTYPKIRSRWADMIQRCYDKKEQENSPSYIECTVSKDWHNFQNYAQWYENNYVEDFHVDKDILGGADKIYSSKTCCFVPREINIQFARKKRTTYFSGVRRDGKKYRARIRRNDEDIDLGLYSTPQEAFQAYKIAKEEHIKKLADKWRPLITPEVYEAMYAYQVEITD